MECCRRPCLSTESERAEGDVFTAYLHKTPAAEAAGLPEDRGKDQVQKKKTHLETVSSKRKATQIVSVEPWRDSTIEKRFQGNLPTHTKPNKTRAPKLTQLHTTITSPCERHWMPCRYAL